MIPPSLPSPTALPGLPPAGPGPVRSAPEGFDAILAALAAALAAPAAAGLPVPSPQPEVGPEPELPREAAPASEPWSAPPPGAELPAAVESLAVEPSEGAPAPGVRAEPAAAPGAPPFLPSVAPAPIVAAAVAANARVAAAGSSVLAPPAARQEEGWPSPPPSVPPAAAETETRPQAEAARQIAAHTPAPSAHLPEPPPERPGPARSDGSRPVRSEGSRLARGEGVQPAPGEGAQREPAPRVVSAGAAAAAELAAGGVTQAAAERAEPGTRELRAEARAAASAGEPRRIAAARGEAGPWQEPRAEVGPQTHPQSQSQSRSPLDLELATVGAPASPQHAAGTGPSAPAAANAPVVSLQGPERVIPERAVWLAEQGGGSARIQLRPPELGEVELVVRVRGRRVEVHVRAEEIGAQQVALEGRERLGDALAAKDLRMEEFRVSLSGGGSGDAGASERRGERGAFEAQPEPGWARAPGAHVDPDETPRTARVANANARGIDLRV
jgi:hypothetical protein